MGDFLQKLRANLIGEKYSLIQKLGEGGCGSVYLGRDSTTGQEIALKLEHLQSGTTLKDEICYYEYFSGLLGFPEIYWSGEKDDYRVMAFELLGPSLADLFAYCDNQFSLKTTVMIMDQLLDRLRSVHSKRVIHRDVKPENFLMGTGKNGNLIYVTDFGISMDYVANLDEREEEAIPNRPRVVGTTRFASIRAHMGQEQSRRDDLEALGYMMVYFKQGRLPWQGLRARDVTEKDRIVMEKKKALTVEQLCSGLPPEFTEYMRIVKSLSFKQEPPYGELQKLFRSLAEREEIEYDNVFDWTERIYLARQSVGSG